jgi:plastocyanin
MVGSVLVRRALPRVSFVLAAIAVLAALLVAALGVNRVSAQGNVTVTIVDFAFDPGSLEIAPGTTVTFVNAGAKPHTATGDAGEFDTGTIQPGGSASITFDGAGTFAYHCEIHPSMVATIYVGGDGDSGGDPAALPYTGVGSAVGGQGSLPIVGALLVAATMLGALGLALRRGGASA